MLKSQDLNKEIAQLELIAVKSSDEKILLRGIVKGIALVLKLMRDIKTNQVLKLKKEGIELVKPQQKESDNK